MAAIKVTSPSVVGFRLAGYECSFLCNFFRWVDALEGCLVKGPAKGTAVAVDETVSLEAVRDERDVSGPFAGSASEENY